MTVLASAPPQQDPRPDAHREPTLLLTVTGLDDTVADVRSVTFEAADGRPLPGFVPGSHLVIDAGGKANAYSLTGDGVHPQQYAISVLRVRESAGGSAWVHDELRVGDVVVAQRPRSAFAPIARASRHLLVAGGIGITPLLSHLRAAVRWSRPVQVIYAFRAGHAALIDEVTALAPDAELTTAGPAALMARLEDVLADQPVGTHLYVCGPNAMIDAVLTVARASGWPESRLHLERFGLDALDAGEPFQVRVAGTGTTLPVPSGTSLLEVLEAAGHDIANQCRQGVCGQCQIAVTGGRPLHRDLYLSDAEKDGGQWLMPCVSRAVGPELEVAL